MTIPRILVIDDQYSTQPELRGNLCYQCGLTDIAVETTDQELRQKVEIDGACAGVVFCSGQIKRMGSVENSIDDALRVVEAGWPNKEGWRWGLILLDVRFDSTPVRSGDQVFGLRILEELVRRWPDHEAETGNSELPIVMLSTVPRQTRARQANRAGAQAYVEKEELSLLQLQELLDEYGLVGDPDGILVGRSYALLKILRDARRVARMKLGNALILGPQGSGKSTLARYIHAQSKRSGAFVSFFSTPSAEQLEYASLFGYWYGAHDKANESAPGMAEEAHRGGRF